MCNGMVESISNAFWSHTSATKRSCLLLLLLTAVSTGQGSGCVRPYMVQNSWVNLTETNRGSFPVGTVLQYSCDPGYLPDGPSILTCTTLGLWTSDPPHCIRSGACLPLSRPENGGYTCHPSPCRMFAHGTVIEFFCDDGFVLSGDYNYLTCQDGQWDGPMQISCVSQGCVRPSTVQHGTTNLTDSNRSLFPVGTVLQYICDPGYLPAGPSILTCTPLGRWSSEPPRCIRSDVCQPPFQPENGGYTCHPAPCQRLSHGTVIEYFCDEGYVLKGDYKYLTCQYGEWDSQMKLSCLMEQDRDPTLPLGMPALSIVASTASSVALILLLVVLFVLLQPKLKSLHRRDQGVSGQPVSIMVEGVQVTLPSYEEAVNASGASASAVSSESRVQIVLSEGQHAPAPEAGPSRPSSLKQQQSEMAVVHPVPPSSSSPSPSPSSSTWGLEHAGAAAPSSSQRRPSAGSDQHSLSLDSEMDYSDDMPLLKEA
ncbi:sushi domain-containing protein 6-like isoform X2 [Epinephelus moara]|uniref:sushi domain-containing protein 6-like isoform X2 n=1 Tax=Epinephelus moara TaxID=300413 RepID=UPI00214F118A|nr:sushi domain-containing protein 6-like isoform X2 [Epinephelus moara]